MGMVTFAVLGVVLQTALPKASQIWYVRASASGANTGESWEDAFVELQSALAVALEGHKIWVAQGTYYPDYDVDLGFHTADRKASFHLASGVALYGGFAGTESTLDERSDLFDQTILSGDIGYVDFTEDNTFHVLMVSNANSLTLLDGFMITNGLANLYPDNVGGGILISQASTLTLRSCTFIQNRAQTGGAIYNSASDPQIECCSFLSNEAAYAGGAISNGATSNTRIESCFFKENVATFGGAVRSDIASPFISNCLFENNEAFQQGGSIYDTRGSTWVTQCVFEENVASIGGAISIDQNAYPFIARCHFSENVAHFRSGAIDVLYYSGARIEHCVFLKNESFIDGGAISSEDESSPDIRDCEFQQNTAGSYGGGLLNVGGTLAITRSRFLKNSAQFSGGAFKNLSGSISVLDTAFIANQSYYGGGISSRTGSMQLQNCTFCQNSAYYGGALDSTSNTMITNTIIWDNDDVQASQIYGSAQIEYSIVQEGYAGIGNLGDDPLFRLLPEGGNDGWGDDPATPFVDEGANDDFGDVRLQPGSPAINTGDPAFVPEPVDSDLDGHARVLCGRVDMGAYESGIGDVNCDKQLDLVDYASWPSCSTAVVLPPQCIPLDFNNDGHIDLFDFAGLQSLNWN